MTKLFMRAMIEEIHDDQPLRFTASTEGLGRDGMVIEAGAWQLENYRKNPVVLWAHDYTGHNLPIGKATDVQVTDNRLTAEVVFDLEDEFARQVDRKYRTGFLNAVSVGWETRAVKPGGANQAPRISAAELLDISAVPVPGDPDALIERQIRALWELIEHQHPELSMIEGERGAIPPHSTEKADEGASWDGPGEVAQASGKEQLRRMHAWVNNEMDPDIKQAYKLPHHTADGQVVWRGVAAAMARLLQAGTQIPDEDRREVYAHLARHYAQFDKEPPEFRLAEELHALGADEIRGLFLEGEADLEDYPHQVEHQERVGAVLNARNRDDLEQAVSLIQGVLERAKKEEAEPDRSLIQDSDQVRDFLMALKMRLNL